MRTEGEGNYEFYLHADLDEYIGKWIVIVDRKIVGSSTHAGDILEKAWKEYPGKVPFLARIPEKALVIG
jgi:hypothetical protein